MSDIFTLCPFQQYKQDLFVIAHKGIPTFLRYYWFPVLMLWSHSTENHFIVLQWKINARLPEFLFLFSKWLNT